MNILKNLRKGKDSYFSPSLSLGEKHVHVTDYLRDGIFHTRHGYFGKVLELESGLYDETLTETELAQAYDKYNRLLRDLIPGPLKNKGQTVVQFICSQRVRDDDCPFEPKTKSGEIIARDVNYLEEIGFIKRRFLIAVLWKPDQGLGDLVDSIRLGLADTPKAYLAKIDQQKKFFQNHMRRIENSSELDYRIWRDTDFLSYSSSVFHRGEGFSYSLTSMPFHEIAKNVTSEDCNGSPEGFEFPDGGNIRSFYWSRLPAYFALGRFKSFISKLPMREFELCWTISHGQTELQAEHMAKLLWFSRGPAFQDHKNDFEGIKRRVGPTNPYGKMSLSLTAYDIDEDKETAIAKASTIFMGCPVQMESRHGPQMIAKALPLNTSTEENAILGRFTTQALDRAQAFLPLFDGPKGKGIRPWINNRGFKARFNVFAGEQNRTSIVLGKTGAGKSVLNGSLMLEFKEQFPEGIIRVVDIRSSYDKLADLLGGSLVKFSAESFKERPFSPFANDRWEEEDIALVRSFICSAITILNEKAELGSEHTEILDEALKICANKQEEDQNWHKTSGEKINPHFIWQDVKTKLEVAAERKQQKDMSVVHELLRWTSALDPTGSYGFLFNTYERPSTEESQNFVVYDLDGITDEKLKIMAAQLTGMKVARDISRFPHSTPKLVVFEELGVYLNGENQATKEMANSFVKNITKTIRKENGIPFGITNAVEDFLNEEGGKSFLRQSVTQIYLPFTDSMVGSLETAISSKEISLNEADIDIIKSLHIKDGEYSQAYVITSGFKGVVNMPLSPAMYALLNTSPTQRGRYKSLRAEGKDPAESIDTLADEFVKRRKQNADS